MSTKIVINLPVKDLAKSTLFYEALGFQNDPTCSDQNAVTVKWTDEILVMLWVHDAYKPFARNREIADTHKTNGVILSLAMDSKEAVQKFAETAKANGGDFHKMTSPDSPEDMMTGYDVEDPDGHIWEPTWIAAESI